MNRIGRVVIRNLLVITAISLSYAAIQVDPLEVNPNIKVLFENEKVRVLDERSWPSQKEGMHDHPDRVIYTLSSYTVKLIRSDGTAVLRKAEPGEVFWAPAGKHSAENVGTTELHVLTIELKEHR